MLLNEQHVFKRGSATFEEFEKLCRNANNLYNATMYYVRQNFFEGEILSYEDINKQFIMEKQIDYYSMPTKISQLIKTHVKNVQAARLIPLDRNHIKVEILYKKDCEKLKKGEKTASIDLGVNNLATVIYPNSKPEIINGRPVKSINQFYNKKLSALRSRKFKSKRKEINLINKRRIKLMIIFIKRPVI